MKQSTKRLLSIAVVSTLIIGAAGSVVARGGFGPGWGGHHGMMGGPHGAFGGPGRMMGGDPVGYADQRLTELKPELGITPEQEDAWNAYVEAAKGRAGIMATHRQAMSGSDTVTPDQRLSFHQEGLEQMQKLVTARRNLYAVLTPEQQAKAGGMTAASCGRRGAK